MCGITKYSTELADKLRRQLFKTRVFREHRTRYDARDAAKEELALSTWAIHGVCLQCRCWAITTGRCKECGHTYSELPNLSFLCERMVSRQLGIAEREVRK